MNTELLLPALRCLMGEWTYYVTSMRLDEAADRVGYAEEVVESKAYADLLQRNLRGKRTHAISDYLLQQNQHFLGALIVAVHKGDPSWVELNIKQSAHLDLDAMATVASKRLRQSVGFLQLKGDEELWALDGQHRLSGIKDAIEKSKAIGNTKLAKDEVTVIFVGHRETPSGRERTRRLFTTLNRNAKAISTGERIVLDEDDACAIITRRLVEKHPLLTKDRVATAEVSQLLPTQPEAFTVITLIYAISFSLLNKKLILGQTWKKPNLIDGMRPSDKQIDALYSEVKKFFDGLPVHFPAVKAYEKSVGTGKAVPYRTKEGGNLLFRPIGLDTYSRAFRKCIDLGMTEEQSFQTLAKVPSFEISDPLWARVLWNQSKQSVIPKASNRDLAADLMLLKAGIPRDEALLLARYRKAVEDDDAVLP